MDDAPSNVDYDYDAACWGAPYHTDECRVGQDHGVPCIQDRLSEASTRLRGYRSQHWLRECLQKPERAETRRFLEQGLLQRSFVYRDEDVRYITYIMSDMFLIENRLSRYRWMPKLWRTRQRCEAFS